MCTLDVGVREVTADPALRVFAAGSLRPALDLLAARPPGSIELDYANARDLAERVEAGDTADVFASASAEHPRALHAAAIVDEPRPFATNRLVVGVPATSLAAGFDALADPATRVVIEIEGVPLGDYTRELLDRLDELGDREFSRRVFANVVAQVQTVDEVAALMLAGEADAAILYATDVAARHGRLRAIELPRPATVAVTCVACVVSAGAQHERATEWVQALCGAESRAIMHRTGFGPPPGPEP